VTCAQTILVALLLATATLWLVAGIAMDFIETARGDHL
jgi:hypothetical protein